MFHRLLILLAVIALSACSSLPPLHEAALFDRYDKAKLLIEQSTDKDALINHITEGGHAAIHMAAESWSGGTKVLKLLIENGADVNAGINTKYRITPLNAAIVNTNLEGVRILLAAGADWRIKGYGNETILSHARQSHDFWQKRLKGDPSSESYRDTVEDAKRIVELLEELTANEAFANRVHDQAEQDRSLPVNVRKDKYMVAVTNHLKQEEYQKSLPYFEMLTGLGVKLSSSMTYFWGEALAKSGNQDEALNKLYLYINKAGSRGKYYSRALGLINGIEKTPPTTDNELSVSLRKDKYSHAAKEHLNNNDYASAVVYFEHLNALGVRLPPENDYFWGEALLKGGKFTQAQDRLYKYVNDNGTRGKYYVQALNLITQAEGR